MLSARHAAITSGSPGRACRHVPLMERRIGATLFERTSRRGERTPIGCRLQDDLRLAFQQIQDGIDRPTAGQQMVGAFVGRRLVRAAKRSRCHRAGSPDRAVSWRTVTYGSGHRRLQRLGPPRTRANNTVRCYEPKPSCSWAALTAQLPGASTGHRPSRSRRRPELQCPL